MNLFNLKKKKRILCIFLEENCFLILFYMYIVTTARTLISSHQRKQTRNIFKKYLKNSTLFVQYIFWIFGFNTFALEKIFKIKFCIQLFHFYFYGNTVAVVNTLIMVVINS